MSVDEMSVLLGSGAASLGFESRLFGAA